MTPPVEPAKTFFSVFSFRFILFICFAFALSVSEIQAQRIAPVFFSKLPQDTQLYPRDQASEAAVPITGVVEEAGYQYISVQVFRNNVFQKYLKSEIKYANGKGAFATETKIKAELADYNFKVYLCKTGDSTLIVERKNVVSGDVYVLSGQSNSTGFFTETDTSKYCRTFGKITQNLNTVTYDAADTLWAFSNQNAYDNGVGTMGLEIQKQLVSYSNVPNCLINAGFHWSSAFGHAQRTEDNPADLNNGYGRMLYRLQKGGLANSVKAYIFRQGETEAYNEGGDWPGNFGRLRKNLQMDLAGLEKIYVFQIDVIYYPSTVGAEIRDYQRRLPDIFPDLRSLATVGTQEFDGLHYGKAGNKQGGVELSRLIARDFYDLKDTANITSPNIKKIFYTNAAKTQVVLVFDEGQELVYPEPYQANNQVTLDMKDFFYFNGESGTVASGKADGNRIILDLKVPQQATMMDLMPMFTPENGPYYPLNGPFIKNKLGMRAFTFFKVPIVESLATPKLTAAQEPNGDIKLSWEKLTGATEYILERKAAAETDYKGIARMNGSTSEYLDINSGASGKLSFRLKGISELSESADYGYAEIDAQVITGVETQDDLMLSVFPNPVQKGQQMNVEIKTAQTGTLSLFDLNGHSIDYKQIKNEKQTLINIPQSAAGYHVIKFEAGDKTWTKKVLVR